MANTNYELYLKQLKEQYKNTGLEDIELDAQISKRASLIDAIKKRRAIESNSIITSNAVNNGNKSLSQIAQENKITWSNEYEAESLNWWEQVGAWVNNAKNTVAEAFLKLGEGIVDAGALVGSLFAENVLGDENASKHIESFIKQDLTNDLVLNQEWYRQADKYISGTWMFGDKASKYSYNDKATQDWVKNIAQGVGSSLGFAALTSVPYVGWGLAAQGVGGQSAEEALKEGATSKQAFLYGLGNAAVESITELTVGKILNLIGKGGGKALTKLTGKQVSGQLANDVVGGIGKSYGKSIALNLIKNFNEEGMEEVVSDIVNPILKMIYKESDENNFFGKYQELFNEQGGWQGLFESYLYGGLSAGVMEGVQVGSKVAKYQSIKAVQFENSMNEVVELNAQLKEEIENNDATKYPNLEDNPKIKKILQQKQFIQEKIANDFKEWLDTVKNNYDELVQAGIKEQDMPRALKRKVGLTVGGEIAMNQNAESIMQEVGKETVESLDYEYAKDDKNATDFKNRTVYVNGKQTFNEYFKTILHESEHIASAEKGSLKESKLTSSIIESMSKDAYNEEFNKQLRLQAKNFVNTNQGTKWLKNNGLTLAAYEKLSQAQKTKINEKMGAENREWFNEEVAAEHLMDSFTSFKEFNKIIKKSNSRGLRKMLNAIQKAFSNNKNKPEGYDKIVKALQDGIKDSRTNENADNRYRESKRVLRKQNKNDIIEDTKGKEEIDNDFRRIQKESKRIFNETLWNSESRTIDEGERKRLSTTIRRWLGTRNSSWRNDKQLNLKSEKYNSTFNFYQNVDADTFHDVFEVVRTYLINGELVDLHNAKTTEDEIGYDETKNYLSEDGMQGFAITKNGDLISVFNADINTKGFLYAIAPVVKENVKTLDCFVSPKQNLEMIYKKVFNFKTASIMDYNMEYDHDDIAKNHSEPKVAFMVNNQFFVEKKTFNKNEYDDAKKWQLENIDTDIRFREVDSEGNKLSEQQQKFFADSKIRDDKGNLLVVYHGTQSTQDFNVFDKDKMGEATGGEKAFFFTNNKYVANEFSYVTVPSEIDDMFVHRTGEKGSVRSFYLNITNPVDFSKLTDKQLDIIATAFAQRQKLTRKGEERYSWEKGYTDEEIKVERQRLKEFVIRQYNELKDINPRMFKESYFSFARQALIDAGYDGIIDKMYTEYEVNNNPKLKDAVEYAVFEPNQIKNVDNLNPTENDDIRFRETEEINPFDLENEDNSREYERYSLNAEIPVKINSILDNAANEDEDTTTAKLRTAFKELIQNNINKELDDIRKLVASENPDKKKAANLKYNFINGVRTIIANIDNVADYSEKFANSLNKAQGQAINEYNRYSRKLDKIIGETKATQVANTNVSEATAEAQEEYVFNRDVVKKALKAAGVDVDSIYNQAKTFSQSKDILKLYKQIKETPDPTRQSTIENRYNDLVKPYDDLVNAYAEYLQRTSLDAEKQGQALEFFKDDLFSGSYKRRFNEPKIDKARESYNNNFGRTGREIANDLIAQLQPQTEPQTIIQERVRIINNARKVATPEMAGIKAQADLRLNGKVYTLNSVNNQIKFIEKTLQESGITRSKNFKIDFEGTTREIKAVEIAMILNEYNNTQYVRNEDAINYSNLTAEQKAEKITDIIAEGLTFDSNPSDNITNDRLSDFVAVGDRFATTIKEFVRSEIETLIANEGKVSKIKKILEGQTRIFRERIAALQNKVSTLSQKVVSLKAELETARGNERKVARLQRQLDALKEQLSAQRKETRKYKKELTQALKQVATLENKNARLQENIDYYKKKNIELYTDTHGIKKIKVEDIKTLLELGKNINPDFKLSSYVLNQISNALSNNKIDVAVDYYMNALMNSDYVDGDTLIPFSELVVMQEAIFGDEYIENGENRDVFAQDMEEIRKGLTSIFEGASISTKGKFLEKISKLWVYNEQIREKLRTMRGDFRQYKRAVLVTRTAQNFYNKIKSDIDGATKSGIRTGGVNPDLVKAMGDFYKITNKLKAEKVLNGELLQPLMELRDAWNLAYMKNQTSETPVNTYFSSEESNPFKVLNDYIDTLINTDEADRNVGYYSIYQKVLNGIKRMFEIEIKLRRIKMGKYEMSLADLSRLAQDENWKKPDEKLESFSFTQSFLTPLAVIEKMAQYDENRVIYQVYEELFESEKRKESAELDLRSTFNDFEKNKDSKAFKKSLKQTYELNGIKAKKGQFLSLYEMFKREQARKHIENRFGGIEIDGVVNQFRDEDGNVDTEKLEDLIKAIEKEFDLNNDNSIASQFLNAVENFFKKARRYKKDVDMQRWGFSNVSDDFYFPIAIAESDRQQNISSDNFFNTQMPGTAAYTFNETTTGTMGAIKLNDIIDVVMNHLTQMSNYAGYGVVADNVKKLWNYKLEGGKTFAQALKSRYDNNSGIKLQRFIATLMNDVQGIGGKQASNVDNVFYKIINKIRGNVATVALGANPKVMFSQAASIPAAMRYIKGKYLVQALKSGFGVGIGNGKLPPKPDMFTYRQQTKQVAQAETQGALAYVGEALEGVKSTLSRGINAFDTYAINVIWKASLLQTRNADGSWNIEEATKLAEKTVFNTQPNYIALGRSEFLRSRNDLVRLFTMFQSQAQQNLSMAYSAIEKIAYKKKHGIPVTRGDWDDLAKALIALLIQGIVYTGMGELFKHIVNNDWKDMNASKEGVNFSVDFFNDNIMGMIPVLNNIELDLKQKWKVNFSNLRAGFLDNVTNIFQNMDGKITGKEITTDLSYITGLPGTNIYKWTKALAQYIPGVNDYVVAFDTSMYQGKNITSSTVKNASTSNLSKTYYRIFTNKYVNLSKESMNVLYSLYSKGYTDVIIKAVPNTYTVNDETRKINYREFSNIYGNVGGVLNEIIKSSQFGGLNEETQAKVITKIINTYYNASKKAQSGETMNLLEKLAYLNKSLDPKTLAAIIEASEIEGDEKVSKKTKITKYINSLRMSASNKYFVYNALGYKADNMSYTTYLKSTLKLTNREIKQLNA